MASGRKHSNTDECGSVCLYRTRVTVSVALRAIWRREGHGLLAMLPHTSASHTEHVGVAAPETLGRDILRFVHGFPPSH
jgi:hypothetical protein